MNVYELLTAIPMLYICWSIIRNAKNYKLWVTAGAVIVGAAVFFLTLFTAAEGQSPFNLMTVLFAWSWALADMRINSLTTAMNTQHKVHQDQRVNDAQVITLLEREVGDFAMTQDIFSAYLTETGSEEKFYEFVRSKLPEYQAQQLH